MRFIAVIVACSISAGSLWAESSLVLLSTVEAQKIKAAMRKDPAAYQGLANLLRSRADADLKKEPWSVTFHRPAGTNLSVREYYSEAPYFWPDPSGSGKSIRKDGERNPNRFDDNHRDLGAMSTAVLQLGAAAYFLDDARYAVKASDVIQTWFEDPGTAMIPSLEHAQAVIGENDGRPTGIIDSVVLIRCAQGMALLQASGRWQPEHIAHARKWFADYLNWLMETKKGVAEGNSGNNHMTWYTAQVAAYAAFLGDKVAKRYAYQRFSDVLVKEFDASGAAPKEEARTNSLSYSTYNLDAFATLCRIAQVDGVDLWHNEALDKALLYIAPYVEHPDTWKHQQIGGFKADGLIFPGLAGAALHNDVLLRLHDTLRANATGDVYASILAAAVAVER